MGYCSVLCYYNQLKSPNLVQLQNTIKLPYTFRHELFILPKYVFIFLDFQVPENFYRNPNSTFLVWPGSKCSQCRRMVHAECDPSSNQTTVSPLSTASEETSGICCTNYVCPVCRARGSTTPSEVQFNLVFVTYSVTNVTVRI